MKTIRALLCAASLVAVAPLQAAPPPSAAQFDSFVREGGRHCATASSKACFARGFGFADRDGDGLLSLEEARAVHGALRDWTLANRDQLAEPDRRGLAVGLLVVQLVGLEAIFGSYDENGDGRLSRAELQADVRLDERPLPVLVRDPDAVDWRSLRARLGPAGALLEDIMPRGS
ncbi:hypothetical protein SH611_14095 [Geminicoccaceae bacterium 1502E]|nr:hypothetical protein [Geminicoccaceae bacterium 1502E]